MRAERSCVVRIERAVVLGGLGDSVATARSIQMPAPIRREQMGVMYRLFRSVALIAAPTLGFSQAPAGGILGAGEMGGEVEGQ